MPEIIVKLGQRVLQRYFFDKDVLSIGRARDNDIVIENLSVSRNHTRVKRQDDKYILIDMNSSNGTMVNGVKVTKTEIVHDDLIIIGKHTLHFVDEEDAGVELPKQTPAPERASGSKLTPPPPPSSSSSSGVPMQQPPPRNTTPPFQPKAKSGAARVSDEQSGSTDEKDYKPIGSIGVLTVSKGKQDGHRFRVYKSETSIGRAPVNDIRIHDWLVSNKHAAIKRHDSQYYVTDLGSWRGTEVSGEPLKSERLLKPGDEIIIGTTILVFSIEDAAEVDGPKPIVAPQKDEDNLDEMPSSINVRLPEEMLGESEDNTPVPPSSEGQGFQEPVAAAEEDSLDSIDDDEFAPMTEDELEALDAEIDQFQPDNEEEAEHRRELWEMTEQEKMFEGYEGQETFSIDGKEEKGFSLIEDNEKLTEAEQKATSDFDPHAINRLKKRDEMEIIDEEMEEEEALYDGEMSDDAPYGQKDLPEALAPEDSMTPPVSAEPDKSETKEEKEKEERKKYTQDELKEIKLWEKALRNRSKLIRKNAAQKLKQLTGKDYDWESQPTN